MRRIIPVAKRFHQRWEPRVEPLALPLPPQTLPPLPLLPLPLPRSKPTGRERLPAMFGEVAMAAVTVVLTTYSHPA